jgi:hypothetical protein
MVSVPLKQFIITLPLNRFTNYLTKVPGVLAMMLTSYCKKPGRAKSFLLS